jgi:hypothetical protein
MSRHRSILTKPLGPLSVPNMLQMLEHIHEQTRNDEVMQCFAGIILAAIGELESLQRLAMEVVLEAERKSGTARPCAVEPAMKPC